MDLYKFHYFNSLKYNSTISSHIFLQKTVREVNYRQKLTNFEFLMFLKNMCTYCWSHFEGYILLENMRIYQIFNSAFADFRQV